MSKTYGFFRKAVVLSFLVAMFGFFSIAQTVTNGDFESWTAGSPDGWTLVSQATDAVIYSQAVAGGVTGDALQMMAHSQATGADGNFQMVVTDITPGKYYDLSIWVKSNDNKIAIRYFDLMWLNDADEQVGVDIDDNTYNPNTANAWTEFVLAQNPIPAPVGATKLLVNFRVYNAIAADWDVSTLLVDDLVVTEHAFVDPGRTADDVTQDPGSTGGVLSYVFDPLTYSVEITQAVGELVPWVSENAGVPPFSGNWVGLAIDFPDGFDGSSDILALNIDGADYVTPILSAEEIAAGELWYYFEMDFLPDANHTIVVEWSGDYAPETFQINASSLALEENPAIQDGIDNTDLTVDPESQIVPSAGDATVGVTVSLPDYMADMPEAYLFDMLVEFDNALPADVTIDVSYSGTPLGSLTTVGGEDSLWLYDITVLADRDTLVEFENTDIQLEFVYSGLPDGYYTFTYSLIVDIESGFVSSDDWLVFATGTSDINVTDNPVYPLPFFEPFESGFVYFDNAESNTVDWTIETDIVFEGDQSTHCSYTINNTNILLMTGPVDLSSTTNPTLRFAQIAKTESNWDHCYVEISVDDGATWDQLSVSSYLGDGAYDLPTQNNPEGPCFDEGSYATWGTTDVPAENTWWINEKFSLADYATETSFLIRFRLVSDGFVNRVGWYLDAIQIYDETCPEPTDLMVENITVEGVDFSWIDLTGNLWNIEIGEQGFVPGTGAATITEMGVTESPFVVTGLADNVDYQIFIQTDCGEGDYSVWAGPVNFTTLPLCPWPIDLAVDELLSDGAIFSWTPGDTETEWNIEVGLPDFEPGTGAEVMAYAGITDNPFTASGIDPDTEYEAYIQADCDANGNSVWVGPVFFTTLPACPAPTGLAMLMSEGNSAILEWDQPGTPDTWDFLWGEEGFNPAIEGTLIQNITDNPYLLEGLEAQTDYGFYVRADCGTSVSTWVGPVSFTTACEVVAAPFFEDFDNGGSLPDCWSNFGTEMWHFATSASGNYCAPSDHTSGTGYFAWVDDSESPHSTDVTLETPLIDISTLTNPALSFWLYSNNSSNSDYMTVRVHVWNGTDWDLNVFTYSGQTNGWQEMIVPLNAYLSLGTVKIQIVGDETSSNSNFYNDISIDDISVDEGPACPAPTTFEILALGATSIEFSWNENGTATEWNLLWGESGFDIETEGTLVEGIAATNYLLEDLDPTTSYQVYVQAICAELSAWAGPLSFTTSCIEITPEWLETFDVYLPDECWSEAKGLLEQNVVLSSTTSFWGGGNFANNSANGLAAKVNNYYTNRMEWLITPSIDLGDGSTNYMLEFDLALTDYANSSPAEQPAPDDRFAVVISTDNGTSWSSDNALQIWDNSSSEYVYDEIATAGEHVIIDLSAYTGIVKIGIYAESTVSNADSDLHVDNVAINVLPACFEPLTLNVENISTTDADVVWTSFASITTFNLVYGTVGFDPETEGTLVETIEDLSYSLSSLTPGGTYQVYVQSVCGGGDVSSWYGPVEFTTIPTCDPPTNLLVSNIGMTSAEVSWIGSGSATEWDINYGLQGFNPFTEGTIIENTSDNPYLISLLDAASNYDVYVRSDCSGDLSPWVGPVSFSTGICEIANQCDFTFKLEDSYGDGWNGAHLEIYQAGIEVDDITFATGTSFNANVTLCNDEYTEVVFYGGSFDSEVSFDINTPYNVDIFTSAAGDFTSTVDGVIVYSFYAHCEEPNCPEPSELSVDEVYSFSVDLSWTEEGTATNWDLIYGEPNFDPLTEGTLVDNVTNPATITSLLAETDYEVYVRSDCGGETSYWVGPISFTTLPSCPAPTAFTNDGETPDGVSLSWSAGGTETLWSLIYGAPEFDPLTEGTTVADINTAEYILTGLSSETEYDVYLQANCGVDDNSTLVGPINFTTLPACPEPWDLTATNITGTSADLNWIEWGAASQWDVIYGASGFNPETEGTIIEDIVVAPYTLDGLDADTEYDFYLRADCDPETSVWVGPVTFTTLATCPEPTGVTASTITSESAEIVWVEMGDAAEWEILWGDSGFDPDTEGTLIEDVTTTLFLLESLNSMTSYDVYVRAVCGVGDLSNWSILYTFETSCGVVTTFPFVESFDGTQFAPQCWLNEQISGPAAGLWDRQTVGTSPTCTPHTGAAMARFNAFSYSSGTRGMLVTPMLNFVDDNYEVDFWMYRDNGYPGYEEGVKVYYNTSPNLTDAELLGIIHRNSNMTPIVAANGWYEYNFMIPEGVSGDSYILFEGYSAYGNNIFIDDIRIQVPPTCPQPEQIVLESVSGYQASISWTETGASTEWAVIYGLDGFDPNTEGTLMSGVVDNPYTITGLTPETDYDVYVQANCGSGDISYWTGPFSFTTSVACPVIIDASLMDATYEALTVEVESGGEEEAWVVLYGYEDFIVGEGTFVNVSENPFTLNGLDAETSYDIYIQADCDADGTSDWEGPFTFTTTELCPEVWDVTVEDVIYDGGVLSWSHSSAQDNWDIEVGLDGFTPGTGTAVITAPGTTDNPYTITGLDSETEYDVYIMADCDALGISEWVGPIDLNTTEMCPDVWNIATSDVTEYGVTISWEAIVTQDTWNIEIGAPGFTPGNNDFYVEYPGVTENPYIIATGLLPDTEYEVYILSDCGALGESDWAQGASTFTTLPSCPVPTNILFTNIDFFSADVSWTASSNNDTWNVEVGLLGFTPFAGEEVSSITSTNLTTWSMLDLEYDTQYEVYIQAECGATDLSDIAGPFSFTTNAPYCANAGPTSTADSNVEQVDITGENATEISHTGCPGIVGTQDLTAQSVDLYLNNIYTIEVTFGSCGGNYAGVGEVWIDWNQNLTFDAATESVGTSSGTPGTAPWNAPVSITFTVPSDAVVGTTRMRVMQREGGSLPLDPCATFTWGSVMDFGVNISAVPLNDETDIVSYSFAEQTGDAVIDSENHLVDIEVSAETDVANLVATFTLSDGASATVSTVDQVSGVTSNDFTSAVTYLVTAEDGIASQEWTVTVSVEQLNDENDILAYTFGSGIDYEPAQIDAVEKTVSIWVVEGTDITDLVATFTLSDGATATVATIDQVSGTTSNDFSVPVEYLVTAEDGSTQVWTVTVTIWIGVDSQFNISNLSISPNPSTGLINLTLTNFADNFTYTIYDVEGRVVVKRTVNKHGAYSEAIDLKVAEGTYYLRIDGDGFTQTEKFIIKK